MYIFLFQYDSILVHNYRLIEYTTIILYRTILLLSLLLYRRNLKNLLYRTWKIKNIIIGFSYCLLTIQNRSVYNLVLTYNYINIYYVYYVYTILFFLVKMTPFITYTIQTLWVFNLVLWCLKLLSEEYFIIYIQIIINTYYYLEINWR